MNRFVFENQNDSLTMADRNRIVALIDMDCFYVQCEQRLEPDKWLKPCVVAQYNNWQGICLKCFLSNLFSLNLFKAVEL